MSRGARSLTRAPASIRTPAPEVDEHTRAVLAELGYPPAEINAVLAAGVAAD